MSQQIKQADKAIAKKTAKQSANQPTDKNDKEELSSAVRKARKLKREPLQFIADSKTYIQAKKTAYYTAAKLGSFIIVLAAVIAIIAYYTLIASPRYVSESQFVVKEAGSNDMALSGLISIGSSSPGVRDALILQTYIQSRSMAVALEESLGLQQHYQATDWDWFSRLTGNGSVEQYHAYYQDRILVHYDEMSEVLMVEVQTFNAEFSLKVANEIIAISETLINKLGQKMVTQQLDYAQQDVNRAYTQLKKYQSELISFQDKFKLYSPEQQGSAIVTAMNALEAKIIEEETTLKSLSSFMRADSADIKTINRNIDALKTQLAQEKNRLTNQEQQSLNKINIDYQEIELNSQLAADLYKSSLASLEVIRSEAFRTLKHLLVIEHPILAQEDKYPRRLYSIFTWFITMLLIYGVFKMVVAVIKEHKE
jgi:capsular polysaccharide transport system permease protein